MFVTDEIVDRFCLVGPPEEHVRKLKELSDLGADQFALYLQHDAKDATLARYGELVIPEVNARAASKV
jgi:alkanesulfonate monooxygenase SsuD/methylene tetrahydromethanopterin reductase-like flavin-dependent oxidoreductase (luciferase family)